MWMTLLLWQKERKLKSSLINERGEEKRFGLNIRRTKIIVSGPITYEGASRTNETVQDHSVVQNHCRCKIVTKIKSDRHFLEWCYDHPRYIFESRTLCQQ